MKKPSKRDYALVDSLVNSACDDKLCDASGHFGEKDMHPWLGVCPVLTRIRAAWARIVAAQEPKPKKEKP